jgi:hypothetical protein
VQVHSCLHTRLRFDNVIDGLIPALPLIGTAQVGLVCGPSGSGKSLIRRQLRCADHMAQHVLAWTHDALVETFFASRDDCVERLHAVGCNEQRANALAGTPYGVLSRGECHIVEVARALVRGAPHRATQGDITRGSGAADADVRCDSDGAAVDSAHDVAVCSGAASRATLHPADGDGFFLPARAQVAAGAEDVAAADAILHCADSVDVGDARHTLSLVYIDEFTSALDRATAASVCRGLARWARAHRSAQYVLITCHDDVDALLSPDWVFHTGARACFWRSFDSASSPSHAQSRDASSLPPSSVTLSSSAAAAASASAATATGAAAGAGAGAGARAAVASVSSSYSKSSEGIRLGAPPPLGDVAQTLELEYIAGGDTSSLALLPAGNVNGNGDAAQCGASETRVGVRRAVIELRMRRCATSAWSAFRDYHYKTPALSPSAEVYVLETAADGWPVGCVATIRQFTKRGSDEVLPPRRAHRTVVLPMWQGLGVGGRLTVC